jgi:uncharacterized protein YndB with AHSA1/START domain
MMTEVLTIERRIWIDAPRERVWEAITTGAQIQQWWGHDHWEISERAVGGVIKFGDADDPMTAIIERFEPPREFTIHWPPQGQYHSISMYTTYLLEDENGGTRVTVRESGFEALPDEVRQERYDSTGRGYDTVLRDLKGFIERAA